MLSACPGTVGWHTRVPTLRRSKSASCVIIKGFISTSPDISRSPSSRGDKFRAGPRLATLTASAGLRPHWPIQQPLATGSY